MSSKRYPDEFKIEAVKQIVEYGHSVADVASRLGTTTHSLYAWIKKFGPDSVGHAAAAAEQAEIKRLKKELWLHNWTSDIRPDDLPWVYQQVHVIAHQAVRMYPLFIWQPYLFAWSAKDLR